MRDMGLFRGMRKDNGEWIEGSLMKVSLIPDTDYYLIFGEEFACISGNITSLIHAAVDPETVGECTYLRDKFGKLIFEGDILSAHFDDKHPENETQVTVEWNDMGWTVRLTDRPDVDVLDPSDGGLWTVIGNIYDDPELLGGGK